MTISTMIDPMSRKSVVTQEQNDCCIVIDQQQPNSHKCLTVSQKLTDQPASHQRGRAADWQLRSAANADSWTAVGSFRRINFRCKLLLIIFLDNGWIKKNGGRWIEACVREIMCMFMLSSKRYFFINNNTRYKQIKASTFGP